MAEPTAVLAVELTSQPEKLLAGFKRADDATGAYAQAAQRHMQTVQATFNGVEFSTVTNKAKAESLKLIELEHQLTIARVSGDKATAAGLQEEITLLQKVRQLRSAGLTGGDATAAAKASLAGVAAAREAAEAREASMKRAERIRGNPAEALEGVFSRSRLGVLEEGGAKIPLFGSSLEALGAAGLVAAGGLAAAGLAAEQVRKSMEYGEEIEKTSKALAVSTTDLQAFDAANVASAVGVEQGRDSLKSFNEVFGKYAEGLASKKTAKFFDALGFTPKEAAEAASSAGGTLEALQKTLERLSAIGNPQQRASLAETYGLSAFLPVLGEGSDGVEKFVAKLKEARESDALLSPAQIQSLAEMNDKVEEISHHIDQEFKKAFAEAAPLIVDAAEFVDRFATAIAHVIGQLPDFARGVGDFASRIGVVLSLANRLAALSQGDVAGAVHPSAPDPNAAGRALGQAARFVPGASAAFAVGDLFHATVEDGRVAKLRGGLDVSKDDIQAGLTRENELENGRAPHPVTDLSRFNGGKAKKGPADPTDGLDSAAKQDADTARQELAQATASLIRGVQAHADAETKAVDDGAQKKLDALAAEEVKIRKDGNDKRAAQQIALIEQAKADTQSAAEAKKELIQRTAREAIAEQVYQSAVAIAAADLGVLEAGQALAHTRTAQAKLAAQILEAEQKAADDKLEHDRDAAKRANPADADKIDAQYDRLQTDSDATFRDRRAANRQTYSTPGQKRVAELQTQADGLGDQLEGVGVKGLDSLADGFVDVATGAKTAQAAVADAVKGIIADLIRLAVQQEIELPLARAIFGTGALGAGSSSLGAGGVTVTGGKTDNGLFGSVLSLFGLPGHASGADSFGGLTKLNEQGPEGVAYLPKGTQIIPNATLRGLAGLDVSKLGRAPSSTSLNVKVDVTGANGDEAVRAIAYQAATLGTAHAIATSRGDLARQAASQRNSLAGY